MKTILNTALLFMMLLLVGCGKPDSTSTEPQNTLTQPKGVSTDQAIDLARQKCRELNIPANSRTPQVKEEDDCFVVEFPPPTNARAGSWIFKIDKTSGKIVDTTIWR